MAIAVEHCGLHNRVALRIIMMVGTSQARLMLGFMFTTMFLSMWISNTATTAMMLPIGLLTFLIINLMTILIAVDAVAMAISEGEPETAAAADDAESLHESEAVSFHRLESSFENEDGMLTLSLSRDQSAFTEK